MTAGARYLRNVGAALGLAAAGTGLLVLAVLALLPEPVRSALPGLF